MFYLYTIHRSLTLLHLILPPGFDTASSIALLAISALARGGVNVRRGDVVIFPVRNFLHA